MIFQFKSKNEIGGYTNSKLKVNKYRNIKVTIDGHVFDSKKEGKRYLILKKDLKFNSITELILQPEFILQDKFKDQNGKVVLPIKYRADFKYVKKDKTIVEDVKGMRTKEYLIKKKIFLKLYPQYIFTEI